jgi:hypothetical protein
VQAWVVKLSTVSEVVEQWLMVQVRGCGLCLLFALHVQMHALPVTWPLLLMMMGCC